MTLMHWSTSGMQTFVSNWSVADGALRKHCTDILDAVNTGDC